MTFGGVPDAATKGETYTQDLVQQWDYWWTVTLGEVNLGGTNIKDSGAKYAILDTGTSLLTMSQADYYNFVDTLPASVDCTSHVYCVADQMTCTELTP